MLFLFALVAVIILFKITETAAVAVSDSSLDKLASNGDKSAQHLKKLLDKPNRFLSASKAFTLILEFAGAVASAELYSDSLADAIKSPSGLSENICKILAFIIIAAAYTFVMMIFAENVPKKLGGKNPEKTALRLWWILSAVTVVLTPFVWLTDIISRGILLILGVDSEGDEDSVTEEEILMMSDAGAESGAIDEDENQIIKNIFAFDDMTAEQICTHRTDVSVLWASDSSEVWEETIHRTRHSFFPVCGENVDTVIGVLNAKDYFSLEDKSKESIMANIVREPYFVHENMKADRLFAQMKKNDAEHFAVVVDEYGGMSGIITITDLVEELVGDFADDEDEERFEKIGENLWNIPGITSLTDIAEELETELPADKYDTFGGYVIAMLGEIPKDGTRVHLDAGGLSINVMEIKHHRIERCRVSKSR